jgi:hypothetical protein
MVRCSPDVYKPFEFMKVDHCAVLRQPWQANCFVNGAIEQTRRNENDKQNKRRIVTTTMTPIDADVAGKPARAASDVI